MAQFDDLKVRLMKGPFTKGELLERATLRSARLIRDLCEEKGDSHSRLIEPPIISDDLVIVGRSAAGAAERRREHVVPCIRIVRRCHEMIADGESDEAVAAFIRRNLRIVLLGADERRRLDGKTGHNLKTQMPKDWEFGACAFQRLTVAGIGWTLDPIDEDLAKAMEFRPPAPLAETGARGPSGF